MSQAVSFPAFVQSTNSFNVKNGVKCLVYGMPSAGKTELLSTLPNPIILSHEGGLLTLRKKNIPFIKIEGMASLQYYTKWLTETREGQSFTSIAFDSLTEIAEVCLQEKEATIKDGRATYKEMGKQIEDLIRFYRDLPGRNVVFTAQQEWEKDEVSGLMHNRPAMPGKKLTGRLPYFFDEVFQAVRFNVPNGPDQFGLRTKPDQANIAKDRSGVLDEWERPDMMNILNKISAKV